MPQQPSADLQFQAVEGTGANFRLGFFRGLPIALGYAPVAFAFGVLCVQNHIPPALAIAMSVFMLAGSGQFITLSMWCSGAGILSTTVAVFVTNLRYILMAVALFPYVGKLKGFSRLLYGWQITDELFALHVTAFQKGWPLDKTAVFTATCSAHIGWVGGTIAGVFCGGLVTDVKPLGLDYALAAMFLALLVPQCTDRLHVLAAVMGAFFSVALKSAGLGQWNVVLATILSATLATVIYRRGKNRNGGRPGDRDEAQHGDRGDAAVSGAESATGSREVQS